MKQMNFNSPKPQPKTQLKISKFRGVNFQTDATLINDNNASKMLNMQLDSVGTLQRFLGYTRATPQTFETITWETANWETDNWLDVKGNPCYGLFYNPTIKKLIYSSNGSLYSFKDGELATLL